MLNKVIQPGLPMLYGLLSDEMRGEDVYGGVPVSFDAGKLTGCFAPEAAGQRPFIKPDRDIRIDRCTRK